MNTLFYSLLSFSSISYNNKNSSNSEAVLNRLPSFKISAFSPWFITFRAFTTKSNVKIFVYNRSGNFFQFPSYVECSKSLGISRTFIRKAIRDNLPYKNYFFSLTPLELNYLHNLGFSIPKGFDNCAALIPFDSYLTFSLRLGIKTTEGGSYITHISLYVRGVIVGLILSDAYIRFPSLKSKNARLEFTQSLAHFDYFWHIFLILSPYCSSYPIKRDRIRFGKYTFGLCRWGMRLGSRLGEDLQTRSWASHLALLNFINYFIWMVKKLYLPIFIIYGLRITYCLSSLDYG